MYEARRQRSSWARIKLSIVRKVYLISVSLQSLTHYRLENALARFCRCFAFAVTSSNLAYRLFSRPHFRLLSVHSFFRINKFFFRLLIDCLSSLFFYQGSVLCYLMFKLFLQTTEILLTSFSCYLLASFTGAFNPRSLSYIFNARNQYRLKTIFTFRYIMILINLLKC